MSQPFIFIGTHKLKEGTLEAFKPYCQEFCEFVEANEPRLIAFNFYVNEDDNEVTIVQVHPDGDSMDFHMGVIGEHIERFQSEFMDETISIQVYGTPSGPTLGMISELTAASVPLTVKTDGLSGFTRSAAEQTAGAS